MEKGILAEWLESKYLIWQTNNGRATVAEFAKFLDINREYLYHLMNGRKTKISQTLAEKIARRLEDSEIQTILKFQPYDQTSVDYEIFGMVWPALSTETKKKIIALLRKEGVNETIIHKLEGTITINQA